LPDFYANIQTNSNLNFFKFQFARRYNSKNNLVCSHINLGVILWEEIPFPSFKKGAAVSIATISNGRICGPLAVGRALLSSDSILASGMKGRGVEILHLFKDQLW
jgi:hypothetical protein